MKTEGVSSAVKFIWFKPGYVESSKVGWLIFACLDSNYTREEAIFSLAEQLYHKYMQKHRVAQRSCFCLTTSKTGKYCSECGRFLKKFEFDPDQFKEWLCALFKSDCNGYEYSYDYGMGFDWEPWGVPMDILGTPLSQHIFLSQSGELAILYALYLSPRIDWNIDFDDDECCFDKESLEEHWVSLIQKGEWALG
ncbi:MAG: hypothetical protein HZA35_02185 [Parcubacteria group bacterium]|nr:hypothetical protein [Parcubacteria group bacterium]